MIILALIIIELVFTFINTGASVARNVNGCTTSDNETTCANSGQTSFFNSLKTTTVEGIQGAPDPFNPIWLTISVFMLALGIILIVLGILGAVFGSG